MEKKSEHLRGRLADYFSAGVKVPGSRMLGVETEHFIVDAESGEALPYSGERGVESILREHMRRVPGAEPIGDEHLLGFVTDDYTVTLEPAAQYEISISPRSEISGIRDIYRGFRRTLDAVLREYGAVLVNEGYQPESRVEELALIPKERYRFMDRYFREIGSGGPEMMRGTASTQISVDYCSEEDFRAKIQAALLITPVLQLLTDNTVRTEAENPVPYLKRAEIWRRTDPDRCGCPKGVFSPSYGFSDYADYLCGVPLVLRQDGDETVYTGKAAAESVYAEDARAGDITEEDVRHVISMVFPDVRLKNYLEIRCADSLPENEMLAYTALIKGALYSERLLKECETFIREHGITEADIFSAQSSLMEEGWRGQVYGIPVLSAAEKLIDFAEEALPEAERHFLRPMRYRISPAGRITEEYRVLIEKDREKNREGALALRADMERSPLYFRGRFTTLTPAIPRVYGSDTLRVFSRIVKTAYGIFTKVIREYLDFEDYRALFPFPEELRDLIVSSGGFGSLLPVSRFDIFYHEDTGDFYFCEVNTDGTSAMNENRLLEDLMIHNPAHEEIIRRYDLRRFETLDSWVKTFLDLYFAWPGHVEKPTVAVVDFLDKGMVREFEEFVRRFQRAGVNSEVCDIRDLRYENGALLSASGHRIDAVYRRAVTSDIMKFADEVRPFLDAVRSRKVFLAGDICTQVIHNKWLFHVLREERTKRFLTEEENAFVEAHIPETQWFGRGGISLDDVLKNKDEWILKPLDSYASAGVYAGVEFSDAEWREKAESVCDRGYICQRYCPQYSTRNIDFAWGDGRYHSYIHMAGLYVYNGELAGVYSRLAKGNGIIATYRNEMTAATYYLSD